MSIDVAAQTPARMSIANVSSGDSIEAQFNPTELDEVLEVNWARQTVPRLSHQPLQFVNTGNVKFTLELQFEAQDPTTDIDRILGARRFLQSLCYPRRGAADVVGGGPPRALFVWPTFVERGPVPGYVVRGRQQARLMNHVVKPHTASACLATSLGSQCGVVIRCDAPQACCVCDARSYIRHQPRSATRIKFRTRNH